MKEGVLSRVRFQHSSNLNLVVWGVNYTRGLVYREEGELNFHILLQSVAG